MDRRKVIDQAISTLQLTEELDWDRLLWIPGEKKFFLPSIELRTGIDWGFDPAFLTRSLTIEMLKNAMDSVTRSLYLGSWEAPPTEPNFQAASRYERYCECVPSRSGFITREVRVPVNIRPVRQGVLYDRYDRRLID